MRIFRPITRSAIDQRRINEASRVSLRVIRPRLDIARGKVAAPVAALGLSDDRNLMAALLQDGTVRLWDLDRGVQLGGVEGDGIVAVGLSGAGRRTQAIGLRRDGDLIGLLPVESGLGTIAVSGVSQVTSPAVLSADGNTLVVKIFDIWHLLRGGRALRTRRMLRGFPTYSLQRRHAACLPTDIRRNRGRPRYRPRPWRERTDWRLPGRYTSHGGSIWPRCPLRRPRR